MSERPRPNEFYAAIERILTETREGLDIWGNDTRNVLVEIRASAYLRISDAFYGSEFILWK